MPTRESAAPLTAQMEAVVERMRRTQSVAVVRVGSQWWAAEADAEQSGDWGEVDGRFRPRFAAFQTSTVAALVGRASLQRAQAQAHLAPVHAYAFPRGVPLHLTRIGFQMT